jgi:hypothetical protein
VLGKNFVQVGLRGYFPTGETLEWMRAQGMRSHFMTEIEERGSEAVIQDAIAEALIVDKSRTLTAQDGQLLGACCHRGEDGKTAQDVGIIGLFSDWPGTTTYYANCIEVNGSSNKK